MNFEESLAAWREAELLALAAESAIKDIFQCETREGHELLAKAAQLRVEANRRFNELVAQAGMKSPPSLQ